MMYLNGPNRYLRSYLFASRKTRPKPCPNFVSLNMLFTRTFLGTSHPLFTWTGSNLFLKSPQPYPSKNPFIKTSDSVVKYSWKKKKVYKSHVESFNNLNSNSIDHGAIIDGAQTKTPCENLIEATGSQCIHLILQIFIIASPTINQSWHLIITHFFLLLHWQLNSPLSCFVVSLSLRLSMKALAWISSTATPPSLPSTTLQKLIRSV